MPNIDFLRIGAIQPIRPDGQEKTATLADEPEQGKMSIGGTGGGVVDLSYSVSNNWSRSHNKESKRTYDKVRIYNVAVGGPPGRSGTTGAVDKSSYIETEVVRVIAFGDGTKARYSKPPIKDNMELMQEGLTRTDK